MQDAAYGSLLKSRRQVLHKNIAETLEQRFPERVAHEPEVVAHHYTEAGENEKAAPHWLSAGGASFKRGALIEAVAQLKRGLALVLGLQSSQQRDHLELQFRSLFGNALVQTQGLASAEADIEFQRARELCMSTGDPGTSMHVLWGVWLTQEMRGNSSRALEIAREMIQAEGQDRQARLVSTTALMDSLFWTGQHNEARETCIRALELYDPWNDRDTVARYSFDMKVVNLLYASQFLWMLGYPDQALNRKREMDAWAEELKSPFMLAFCRTWGARIFELRGEFSELVGQLHSAEEIARTHGFPWFMAHIDGWSGQELAHQGAMKEGAKLLEKAISFFLLVGGELIRTLFQPLLAHALANSGQAQDALVLVEETLNWSNGTGESSQRPETERIRGEILLRQREPRVDEAEASFKKAIQIARETQTRGWELRASMSLARLWESQGKRKEAYDLLAPAYNWFTEGFGTKDLKEARALLDSLVQS